MSCPEGPYKDIKCFESQAFFLNNRKKSCVNKTSQ